MPFDYTFLHKTYINIMGYFNSLGKGFVRSAINQVGRDTGRLISNGLYGNKHSIPYRNNRYERSYYMDKEDRKFLYEDCKHPNFIIHCVIAFFFSIFGGIGLLCYGLYLRTKINIVQGNNFYECKTYITDNRHKSGVRYNGNTTYAMPFKRDATPEEINKNKNIANKYIIAGIIYIIILGLICIIQPK